MTYLKLDDNQFDQVVDKFGLDSFGKNRLKRLLSPAIQIKFLKPSSEAFKQEVLIGRELLKCDNFHSPRMPLLKKVVRELDLGLATFSKKMNFDILKQYGIVTASQYAGPNQAWIELNDVGQAYFSLLFGEDDKPTESKDKSKKELYVIIEVQKKRIDSLEKRVGDFLELESKIRSITKILND